TANTCIPGERGWAGHEQGFWEYMVVPLGAYVGQELQYKFTFGSDGSVQYSGFFLDDLVIWGGGPAGEIAGQVRRIGTNAPIQGATITTLEDPSAVAQSDATGAYVLDIEPGTYTVLVHKQGYCDISDPNVVVEDGNTTTRFYTMSYPMGSASVTSVNLQTELETDVSGQFDLVNSNNATCEFMFEISSDVQWLSFTPDEGEVPMNNSSTITVTADVSGMPIGTYNATIHVENNGETNPIDIPVVLDIAIDLSDIGVVPTEFAFYQNYPNPFNATTALQFDVPVETAVEIVIFNVMGQIVDKPVSASYPAGHYKIMYTADALPSGMYLVKMTAGEFNGIHKMMLLK
ncbi:carboxypeptidase regulatory-like domain-containing protein, partial [bacterium]|nr:carboxypeptidase regulatory-like domain-containing protein [bacterium]